ncbi:MAG: nickel pincer cofactor biosynthesis protein LarB [Acidimicrobiia bacterium]|nr:nickel pincer cofactor biosynthesis protein LarB [Acidimicrobiia bacterium]
MHVHDHNRFDRIGMPEAVLCSPKTPAQLDEIVAELGGGDTAPVLFTRLTAEQLSKLASETQRRLEHDPVSSTAYLNGVLPRRAGRVAIVAAGTSDLAVAREAQRTLHFCGVTGDLIVDVGVAGLWRLERRLPEIRKANVVIAVAGMDAALVSVLGGLVHAPVIAAPTSVGYGVSEGGRTALHSSLASCAQGVTVVNIDNGFGAACAAVRILGLLGQSSEVAAR